jgi:PGF-CTERM protein
MYDVYFGGKQMTKRLTIALIALVALVLVAVLPVSAAYYQVNNSISNGATVYLGEVQLNLTPFYLSIPAGDQGTIGFWTSGSDVTSTPPSANVNLTATSVPSFSVSQGTFGSYLGTWYVLKNNGFADTTYYLNVKDPSLSIDAWDYNTSQIVTGKTVIQGDLLTIRVTTNLNEVYNFPARSNLNPTTTAAQGNIDIKLKSDTGNTYSGVYNQTNSYVPLTGGVLNVNLASWYLGTPGNLAPPTDLSTVNVNGWFTGATDTLGNNAYPAGVYSVYAESRVNGMKDNYQNNGADYTGKTISGTGQVTIASNTVKIEANKDSVVRSKSFSVTVTGRPNTYYYVWVKGVSSLDNTYDNQPPMITSNQLNVFTDAPARLNAIYNQDPTVVNGTNVTGSWSALPYYVGAYAYQNGAGNNVYRYVGGNGTAADAWHTNLYAIAKLGAAGTSTIQFSTSNFTKAQKYTIRVEQNFSGQFKSDEVDVKIEKGAVTIVAAGDQSYYLGEEVKFSGTNTESQKTYLFITGPNLPTRGGIMSDLDPRNAVGGDGSKGVSPSSANNQNDFAEADVLGDNTWSYKWGTSAVALDAGTYTVYAVSIPTNEDNLNKAAYGTVSIIVKKPFISATASQSTVAKGDAVYITGTAQGQPSQGVRIWILGKNYAGVATESVNSDASFSYELKKEDTKNLYAGQYFIVAQHPMQNDQFDIYPASKVGGSTTGMPFDTTNGDVKVYTANQSQTSSGTTDSVDFKLTGSGSLQGSDAAEALIEAINDANVDDTYTKLQILIEEPVITIDTIGDRHVGDKFTITATTNLAVDDEVLFEVYSSSFQPTQKSQSGEFSGASGTVKVTKGDSGLNKLSFDVDASTFKPDEYLVKASAVLQDVTGTALFNVLEASAPTATPTVANVTAAPTTVATTIPPTTVATPTKTPTQPGFGALVALIGLGAVALLVVRRH